MTIDNPYITPSSDLNHCTASSDKFGKYKDSGIYLKAKRIKLAVWILWFIYPFIFLFLSRNVTGCRHHEDSPIFYDCHIGNIDLNGFLSFSVGLWPFFIVAVMILNYFIGQFAKQQYSKKYGDA